MAFASKECASFFLMSRTRIWLVLFVGIVVLAALIILLPGIARAMARNRAALDFKSQVGTFDLKGASERSCAILAPNANDLPTCAGDECYLQGVRANLGGDWVKAADLLKMNDDALSLYQRGLASWCNGNQAQALAVWTPIKELVSERFMNIGYIEYVTKQYNVALEWLDLADAVYPTARNMGLLGTVYENLGDLPRALQYYKEAVQLDPTNALSLFQAANVALELGEKGAARTYIESALRIAPNNWLYWQKYGDVLRAQENWGAAEQAYRRVVTLNPTYVHGNGGLGYVLVQEGRIADARPYILAAVQYTDSAVEKANELLFYANAASHSGDHATAIEILTQARMYVPNNPGFLNALLVEYAAVGECTQMQQVYEQAQKQFLSDQLPPMPNC